ncbi:Imm52 family immunity protein [Roseateles toxinivorans]|uniref:Imm52 family immunity protein n=1 Tax=Roseateles toxinivorans TaxID=270368 RepID=UPI003C7A733E
MPSKSIVALYWESRASAPSESAAALLPAFEALRCAGFGVFFRKGRSKKAATAQPLVISHESLEELLSQGANLRDVGRQPILELGQSLGLWSGGPEDEAYALAVQIGSTSPHSRNCFVLQLPGTGPHSLASTSIEVKTMFTALVQLLLPSQAIVCEASAIRWEDSVLAANIPHLVRYKRAA